MWWTQLRSQLYVALVCAACSDPSSAAVDADIGPGTGDVDASTDARVRPQQDGSTQPRRDASDPGNETCARIDARPRPKASAVWFVINPLALDGQLAGAGNTSESTNRDMLRELLFGAGGVVPTLGGTIQFGLASHAVSGPLAGACPNGEFVPAALNRAAALADAYERLPRHQGASWSSMARIADELTRRTDPTRDTIVLIQDENGDASCELFVSAAEQQRKAVEQLASAGAHVSVMSLLYAMNSGDYSAERNAAARALAMQLAELGHGQAFASDQADSIRKAIEDTVDEAVSCEIRLEGKVERDHECEGSVELAGSPLACNQPNGFRLLDESTLELTGEACDRLRTDAKTTLSASFPCDVFIPVF